MQWPKHLLDAFESALGIEPIEGLSKLDVLRTLLDETARRAIQRAGGDPSQASAALRMPYTPLGSVVTEGANRTARRLSLGGPAWSDAVEAFHGCIEDNAAEVFAAFAEQLERNPPRPWE